ncbi:MULTISPECIES: VOC family protein [Sphingobium]|uniref:VOC domain-containing protein n=1 Tax=Sphingobium baderi TaxID=1332080 RepID=A0A0S3EZR6_9SPHN|nr:MULTISPECIES: VOC family protein [Sphingobium]ALR20892.1 hypothetical protein ATN00_11885 [Sphingobium baderi]
MAAVQLDHVNIRTARLAECVEFYGNVLGLTIAPPPMASDLTRGAYVLDERGAAIVHLIGTDKVIEGSEPVRGAAQRGMIDHFALRGVDPEAYVERLTAHGCDFTRQDVPAIAMHLIFVRDPNDVMVELSFPLES